MLVIRRRAGFTLSELLLTLCLVSILSALAFPSFQSLLTKQHDSILQDTIIHLIQFAQDEAIATSKPIALSIQENKMIIFTDDYHDGVIHQDSQRKLAQQIDLRKGKIKIRSFPFYRSYLLFKGVSNDNATITYYDPVNPKWSIVLSQTGRWRLG